MDTMMTPLALPASGQAVLASMVRTTGRQLMSAYRQSDPISMARFVRQARTCLPQGAMSLLSGQYPREALQILASACCERTGARFRVRQSTLMDDVMTERLSVRAPIDRHGVVGLAHAGMRCGLYDADSLQSAITSMDSLEIHFAGWWTGKVREWMALRLESELGTLPDGLIANPLGPMGISVEGHADSLVARGEYQYGLTVCDLAVVGDDSADGIMLRDMLCLLMEALGAFGIGFVTAGELLFGNCYVEDDAEVMKQAVGEGASTETVLTWLQDKLAYLVANDPNISDPVDAVESMEDEIPSLFVCNGNMESWAWLMALKLDPTAPLNIRHLPPSQGDEPKIDYLRTVLELVTERFAAVRCRSNLVSGNPKTIEAIQYIVDWMQRTIGRPEKVRRYLEMDGDIEGVLDYQLYSVTLGYDRVLLASIEAERLEGLHQELMEVGVADEVALVDRDESYDELPILLDRVADSVVRHALLMRLAQARDEDTGT